MTDQFRGYADSVGAPSRHIAPRVPSDAADLAVTPKGIYVGTGGVTFRNLPSGSLLPVRARRVLATGTTAADMLVLL